VPVLIAALVMVDATADHASTANVSPAVTQVRENWVNGLDERRRPDRL
jgi:hypothetical protein